MRPSPATVRAAAALLGRRAGLPAEAQARATARSVASVLQGFLALPACRLWDHPLDLQEAALTKEQVASGKRQGPRVAEGRHLRIKGTWMICSHAALTSSTELYAICGALHS
jgi:hypothetical protein